MSFIEPAVQHHFGGGVYAKEMRMPANYLMLHHKHKFDHLSILASGSIELMVDGKKKIIHAPACLTIEANAHHGIKSLTEIVWYCVHATDCTDEDRVDEVLTEPHDIPQVLAIAQDLVKES